jgi:hypothetical protein
MTDYELSDQERTDDERRGVEAVAKRVSRALDGFFHVEAAGDNSKYTVFSGSGETYTVDASDGSCTCPDGQRGSWCKHAHRVAFVTGEVPDIDGVHGGVDEGESDTDADDTDAETDDSNDSQTLADRVEQFAANNPGASAIEAIGQLGISPDNKERVEEVLA